MPAFGISLGVSPREPISHALEVLRLADGHGVDCAWVLDSQLILKDVYVVLALAAAGTHRIQLGTGVTNPLTRHLTVTANAASALREVSGGRFLLGLGAGDSAVFPLGQSPATLKTVEESIWLLRGWLEGEERGKVRLKTAQGPVPIFLAASQPRMLRLAGKVADGVIVMAIAEPEATRRQLAFIREGAGEVGRDPEELYLDLWLTLSVSKEKESALRDVRSWASTQARWLHSWKSLPPRLRPFEAEISSAAEGYDFSEHLFRQARHQDLVSDAFADAVAIAGDPAHCAGRLKEMADLGVDRITVTLLSGGREERLRVLCEEVFPRVGAGPSAP